MIGSKIIIEYYDHNEEFGKLLPRTGIIIKQCKLKGDSKDWFLVTLDKPFDYHIEAFDKYPTHTFDCKNILIKSKWLGFEIGDKEEVAVFIMLAYNNLVFEQDIISLEDLFHVAWGTCSVII
jgi:hypothetical protein